MVVAAHEVGHEQAQLGEVVAEDERVLAAEVRVGQPGVRILPRIQAGAVHGDEGGPVGLEEGVGRQLHEQDVEEAMVIHRAVVSIHRVIHEPGGVGEALQVGARVGVAPGDEAARLPHAGGVVGNCYLCLRAHQPLPA